MVIQVYQVPPDMTPSVVHLRESDQQLICKALICMREISSAALHKLRRQGCDDDDLAVQEIELDIEQAEAMYGAITGEEMPSS